jgi:hypothetical protein
MKLREGERRGRKDVLFVVAGSEEKEGGTRVVVIGVMGMMLKLDAR